MYVIIKHIKSSSGNNKVPGILLNTESEIWEFNSFEEAEKMKDLFQTNSDSGYTYEVKKI